MRKSQAKQKQSNKDSSKRHSGFKTEQEGLEPTLRPASQGDASLKRVSASQTGAGGAGGKMPELSFMFTLKFLPCALLLRQLTVL